MKYQFELIYIFLLLLILPAFDSCHSPHANKNKYYRVVKVVDGDTFWIDDGSDRKKIRLIGVDAPETRRTARRDIGFYAVESKKYLTGLILDKDVRLEYDADPKDRYGRTLAYVYLRDGTFVNAELVRRGYAMVMTVPPNVKHAEEFVGLQREARENHKGLWAK